jgi:hypothetical protein
MAKLTKTKRRNINRNNGRKSRGPITTPGKAMSRRSAIKHGMRAKKLTLPNEDPQEANEQARRWLAAY